MSSLLFFRFFFGKKKNSYFCVLTLFFVLFFSFHFFLATSLTGSVEGTTVKYIERKSTLLFRLWEDKE